MARAGEATTGQQGRDAAVLHRTGRTWLDWFGHLDAQGAARWEPRARVEHLASELAATHPDAGPWWPALIALAYEQARGLRSPEGAAEAPPPIRKSRTLNALPAALFDAWSDARQRGRWLGAEGRDATLLRGSLERGLRLAWPGELGLVEVLLLAKGFGKTQVTVQHCHLPDGPTRAAFDRFWTQALEQLHRSLENAI